MSLEKVQLALLTLVKETFTTGWENRISWENAHFTQPKSGEWLSVKFMPADERIATLGALGLDEATGLFQISLFVPTGGGEGNTRETINVLRNCFRPRTVENGGQGVRILSRSRGPASTTTDSYQIPFTVKWQAQIPRNS